MILVCYILAVVYFKLKVERIKGGKLVSVISWLVIIGFGCLHFMRIVDSGLFDVLLITKPYTPNTFLLIIEGIILLIINLLTVKNKFKAIILTLCQLGISVIVIAAIISLILGLFAGGDRKRVSSGNSGGGQWTEQFSQTKGTYYTDGQGNFKDQYGNDVYNPQGVSDYDKL